MVYADSKEKYDELYQELIYDSTVPFKLKIYNRVLPNNAIYNPSTTAACIQTYIFHIIARFTLILNWPQIYNYILFPIGGPELVRKSIITSRDYTIFLNVLPDALNIKLELRQAALDNEGT